jgi:hypothetical protein
MSKLCLEDIDQARKLCLNPDQEEMALCLAVVDPVRKLCIEVTNVQPPQGATFDNTFDATFA